MEDTTRTTDTKRDILRFYFIIKQLQETNSIRNCYRLSAESVRLLLIWSCQDS